MPENKRLRFSKSDKSKKTNGIGLDLWGEAAALLVCKLRDWEWKFLKGQR